MMFRATPLQTQPPSPAHRPGTDRAGSWLAVALLIATSSVLLSNSTAFAANEPPHPAPLVLDWKKAAEKAIEANPDLGSVRAQVDAAEFERRAAFSGFLPQLSVFGSRGQETTDVLHTSEDRTTDVWGFQAQLNLFNGFGTTANVQRARASRDVARADLRVRSADIRADLRRAYFNAALADRRVRLAERILERREQNRAFMKLKYEGGSEALWSLQQAEADLEAARVRLESEKLAQENALTDLRRLLHLPESEPVAVSEDVDPLLVPLRKDAVASGLERHPDLETLERQVERSRAESRQVRSEYFPQISLSYQWNNTDTNVAEPIKDTTVLLKLEIPLFTGLSTYHNLQRANALTYSLENSLLAATDFVRSRLLKAKKNYDTSLLSLPVASAQLRAAESRATTVTSQYRLGLRRYLEWEDAQSKLILSEQNAIQVRADALANLAEWERALGLGLEDL